MNIGINNFLLDACVLAVINNNDTYGYALTQQVKKNIDISESTLYPILRRLQKDGLLTTYDLPFDGRNRRYYQITPFGKEKFIEYKKMWDEYKMAVDDLFSGGQANE